VVLTWQFCVGFIVYVGSGNVDWIYTPVFATQVAVLNVGLGNDIYLGSESTLSQP
jgi:hypothetical protein